MPYASKEHDEAYHAAYREAHRAKHRDYMRAYNRRNAERLRAQARERHDPVERRRQSLWTKYRMTPAEFDERMAAQDGRCAICRVGFDPEAPAGRSMAAPVVDHDHTTGDIRGLLCGSCNRGLGYLADDPERLRSAAAYLELRA